MLFLSALRLQYRNVRLLRDWKFAFGLISTPPQFKNKYVEEYKMTKKVMKLLDDRTGLMECRVCGARHAANIRPLSNGKFYRGAWQCQNGCKLN